MRIGILGGTFNPVHQGHLLLAEGALAKIPLDQVLWIPAAVSPHKPLEGNASAQDRYRMVELAIQNQPAFRISRIELDRPPPSYTIDTVRQLQADPAYRGAIWYFLIGSDAAQELSTWREIKLLMTLVQFVAIPRPGRLPAPLLPGVLSINVETLEISASEIRGRVKHGQSIEGLVPEAVRRYIEERGLYR